MTNQQILERAIAKAIEGGWKPEEQYYPERVTWMFDVKPFMQFSTGHDFMFNHDFAKALWGEEPWVSQVDSGDCSNGKPLWHYHLQNMVIAADPIAYLSEHIDG